MSDFQKYLDEAFSKINTSDFSDSEEDLPRDDVYKEIYEVTNHSATEFAATGCYSNKQRKMLYSVVSSSEAKVLVSRVQKADPQANISNIENGVTGPTIDSLQKIAEALGKRLLVCFEESEDI